MINTSTYSLETPIKSPQAFLGAVDAAKSSVGVSLAFGACLDTTILTGNCVI